MNSAYSWVDLISLSISVASLGVTLAIFFLGRRLSFRQQRERIRELEEKAWKVLGPIRTRGLSSKVIVMNVARYKHGYDGGNSVTRRGHMYAGAELIEISYGGVQMILSGIASFYDADQRRTLDKTDLPAPNVIQVGHIPWKWIEDIAPEGDEFDGSAIFFVRHAAPGRGPFDFVTYREGKPVPFGPNNRDYYRPIPELGTVHPKFFKGWWQLMRSVREHKKIEKLIRSKS
ncbi:hypothetical protein [Arthrobacter sp. HLT1-21]